MSSQNNHALAQRLFGELFSQGNLKVADEIYATDHVSHDPSNPGVNGPEGMKQFVSTYRTAFPDLRIQVEDVISEGSRVVIRWHATGTHRGSLMGMPPTGKQVSVTGINILAVIDGKIKEEWINWDTLGLMQQIGAIPAMA